MGVIFYTFDSREVKLMESKNKTTYLIFLFLTIDTYFYFPINAIFVCKSYAYIYMLYNMLYINYVNSQGQINDVNK